MRSVVRKRLLPVNRNKGSGDFVEGAIMGKAPLCKGSSCEAGEGLWRFEKLAGKDRALFLDNPSVIFLRKCHLPLHKGGFGETRLRVASNKCMAGRPI